MTETLILESLVLVAAATLAVAVCLRAGLAPVVGYLVAGMVIGPAGLGLLAPSEGTRFLAELGVVLLMFLVGLEFSLPRMIAARGLVFGLGGLQVGLSALAGGALALALGADLLGATLVGGAVAMSSTAVSLKTLADLGQLASLHGRMAVGVLLFQDLATLPFLATIGALRDEPGGGPGAIAARIALAAMALVAATLLARGLLQRLIARAAATRSPELFLLAVLALLLATAAGAGALGLSAPLGAFLVGMVIGESDFRHQVEADIRPFRDVLLGLFFVTVGMQMDPAAILAAPGLALGALAFLVVAKAGLVLVSARLLGRGGEAAARAAVILAHGGEFGLLILTLALGSGLVSPALAQPLLGALAVSLALAPVLIQFNGALARLLAPRAAARATDRGVAAIEESGRALSDHVILAGCGRVGRLVAGVLEAAGVPYLAIERDYARFRRARREGHAVEFGDASAARILDAAGLARARVVVVTFDSRAAVRRLLAHLRAERPDLPVIASVSDEAEIAAIVDAGATVVLPENLAAGLAVGAEALVALGFAHDEVAERISEVRLELVPTLSPGEEGEEIADAAMEAMAEETAPRGRWLWPRRAGRARACAAPRRAGDPVEGGKEAAETETGNERQGA